MKKKIVKIGLLCLITLTGVNYSCAETSANKVEIAQGDNTTDTFKVYGNCGMCKKTIEKSLKNVDGVEKANWDKETKIMVVTYDSSIIGLKEIKQKIADVGYDTDSTRATDEAYNNLHGCCQYDRP
jgi:copper chaperone CopZ